MIALSSSEAEYFGLASAPSQMLGLQSILLDWAWKFKARVWMDATAGIATGSRRGLGRVKHIDTVPNGHGRQDLARQETYQRDALRTSSPTKSMLQRC